MSPPGMSHARRTLPKRAQLALLAAIAVLLVAGGFGGTAIEGWFGLAAPDGKPADAARAETGQAFKVTARQWSTLKVIPAAEAVFQETIETDGRVALNDDFVTSVFSPYSGRVTRLIARPGDRVSRGDPLFAIQASELVQAQSDLISAAAAARTAKAQLVLSTTNELRQRGLYQAQGASLKDWQQSQLDLAVAQGGASTSSIALAATRNRLRILGKTDRDIAAIEETQDVARLEAEAVVTAPIDGTVVLRQMGVGQYIVSASSGAANPVYQIADRTKLWLVANVREEDAPRLHVGDLAEASVLALPDRRIAARLVYVAPAIDPVTHRLLVRAEVDNADGMLKPEMFARFRIVSGPEVRAPAVPAEAVIHEAASAHVWVADPGARTLSLRQIVPGRARDGLVEVVSGLKAGEAVVAAGAVFIDRAATGD